RQRRLDGPRPGPVECCPGAFTSDEAALREDCLRAGAERGLAHLGVVHQVGHAARLGAGVLGGAVARAVASARRRLVALWCPWREPELPPQQRISGGEEDPLRTPRARGRHDSRELSDPWPPKTATGSRTSRSEERRVGKESRRRGP